MQKAVRGLPATALRACIKIRASGSNLEAGRSFLAGEGGDTRSEVYDEFESRIRTLKWREFEKKQARKRGDLVTKSRGRDRETRMDRSRRMDRGLNLSGNTIGPKSEGALGYWRARFLVVLLVSLRKK